MILLPLTVVVRFIAWWLFFVSVDRSLDELVVFAALGFALAAELWVIHEAVAIATDPLGARGPG